MQNVGDSAGVVLDEVTGPVSSVRTGTPNTAVITRAELAGLFGTSEGELTDLCDAEIRRTDLRYRRLESAERDQIILDVLRTIFSEELPKAGKERQPAWERGWRENLDEFVESGFDTEKLIPKYFKKNVPVRLGDDYVLPLLPDFVFSYADIFRTWLFRKYFCDARTVCEFGCGPAYHQVKLAELFPDKPLVGLDWAPASQEIIEHLAQQLHLNVTGVRFNFFTPAQSFTVPVGSGVLTYGALEQLGSQFGPLLEYLLAARPSICVHVEGISEFYDPNNLVSFLALQYHRKRNYLNGFATALEGLQREGRIEIVGRHHHRFGNKFDDSFSYVIWRPI
jgi:hypothetical protein